MIRFWIGVALLAGSWLFGTDFYRAPMWPAWALLVIAGVLCLVRRDRKRVALLHGALSVILLMLPAAVLPWPGRVVPLLLLAGLLLLILPFPRRWPHQLGTALCEGAVILLVQALALWAYCLLTARTHELPALLARGVGALARLMGATAAYTGTDVALHSMRKTHLLAPTWELFCDPATVCFLVGGLALLALRKHPVGQSFNLLLLLVLLAWLPLRCGLLIGVFLHRTLLTGYDDALVLMNQFWHRGFLLALLGGPALLAWRLVRLPPADDLPDVRLRSQLKARETGAFLLAGAAGALLCAGIFLDPVGPRKAGRLAVGEFHTTWEPTQRPYDTTWYGHDAGYNYACIYDYCSRFYDTRRLTNAFTRAELKNTDVLMLKVPTSAYEPGELDLIRDFVAEGGGLLLIGEHTDVFLTSTHLNQVARMFGFEFRKDCLFGIDSSFDQLYGPSYVPHPIVQNIPPMDFAVSCSIVPHQATGRAVIRSTALWSLPSDYHASNFYPQVEDRADMRYGAFVQLWATQHGAGRVVAFTDSTIFSNFSTFEPGKAELMLGMLEWLNRSAPGFNARVCLLPAAFVLLLAGAAAGYRRIDARILLAACLCGWAVGVGGVNRYHRHAMPLPPEQQPLVRIIVDRTLSDVKLGKCGFIQASPEGFGIFEQWIMKLGYFASRRSNQEAFSGNVTVFLQPSRPVTEAFREQLVGYVKEGGKVLIVDSALNTESTANSLLHPFGLSIGAYDDESGVLQAPEGWPSVPVESAVTINGGEHLAGVNGKTVAAMTHHGKGVVVAVGFGSRFNDDNMGITTEIEPGEELRQVFELQFDLLRYVVESDGSAQGSPAIKASSRSE